MNTLSTYLLCGCAGLGLGMGEGAVSAGGPPAEARPGSAIAQATASVRTDARSRPPCPEGWTAFKHPLVGMEAYVPTNYWVRLRGGGMLTVEKQDNAATLACLVAFRPRANAQPADIASLFAKFVTQSEPQFQAEVVGQPSADRALSRFASVVGGKPVEGKYCTFLTAGGTMAVVIGVQAPQGRLEQEQPVLEKIAQGFGFSPARGRWTDYQSPAGGFTLTMPAGWTVQSNDGRTPKDNIDWVASDPQKPLSRAFQWCPRYCSPQLLSDPLHALRGYQAAQFASHREAIVASLSQISQNVRVLKLILNQPLTDLFRRLSQPTAQTLAALGAGGSDVVVYDCLAHAELEGKAVLVALCAGVGTQVMPGGFAGQLVDLNVTLRGWCAEPESFVNDTPVLERVSSSMQLTPAFLNKITQGNQQATDKIRETYAYMNKIDDQIRQSRWDTLDAIAEMNYDLLRDTGGYVNEKSGRIEQLAPDQVVKNSRGDSVSREEVRRGISPDRATVLREAYSNDYMRGAYGRIAF
jgi:hypothetical protein